jgi:predicted DNA-binding antitoxin AbrB/MazE fold protein
MGLQIEAIYDHGTLKLPRELPLDEGQKVTITIHPPGGRAKKGYGIVAWNGSQEELDRFLADPEGGMVGTP